MNDLFPLVITIFIRSHGAPSVKDKVCAVVVVVIFITVGIFFLVTTLGIFIIGLFLLSVRR